MWLLKIFFKIMGSVFGYIGLVFLEFYLNVVLFLLFLEVEILKVLKILQDFVNFFYNLFEKVYFLMIVNR